MSRPKGQLANQNPALTGQQADTLPLLLVITPDSPVRDCARRSSPSAPFLPRTFIFPPSVDLVKSALLHSTFLSHRLSFITVLLARKKM